MTKTKHTMREKIAALLIVILAFVIVFVSINVPLVERITGCAYLLFVLACVVYMIVQNKRNVENKITLTKSLKLKVLFGIIIAVCMILNVFSTYTTKVAEHLLGLYTM